MCSTVVAGSRRSRARIADYRTGGMGPITNCSGMGATARFETVNHVLLIVAAEGAGAAYEESIEQHVQALRTLGLLNAF